MKKNNTLAYIYGGLAILLWSTVATAFKIALRELSVPIMLFYSALSSLAIITLLMLIKKEHREFFNQSKRDLNLSLVLGSINPFGYYLVLFKAYELIPAQEAQPLNYTWPLMLTLLSVVFLKEKISYRRIAGILLSFTGIILISTKGSILNIRFSNIWGSLLALSSSVLWAVYWLANSKDNRLDLVKMTTNFLVGTLLIAGYLLIKGGLYIPSTQSLLSCVYIGFFEMGVTFVFWGKGLSLIDQKEKLVKYSYLGPFISLIFLSLIIKEKILLSTIAGLVLIIFGIVI